MESLFLHFFEVKFDLVVMFFFGGEEAMILSIIFLFYSLDNRTNLLVFNFPNAFPRSKLSVSVFLLFYLIICSS